VREFALLYPLRTSINVPVINGPVIRMPAYADSSAGNRHRARHKRKRAHWQTDGSPVIDLHYSRRYRDVKRTTCAIPAERPDDFAHPVEYGATVREYVVPLELRMERSYERLRY
jgi:hypothetical protein